MKKSRAEATTAKNLEAKFDRGEEVLDYFDVRKARLVAPAKGSAVKTKFAYSAKWEFPAPRGCPRKIRLLRQEKKVGRVSDR